MLDRTEEPGKVRSFRPDAVPTDLSGAGRCPRLIGLWFHGKSLFAFGHQVGYLPFDVGRPVKLPSRRDERAERILSADDVHSVIAHAKKGRDRALIRTLYIGGLRVTEAVSLATRDLVTRDDGSEASGQLQIFGKGSKTRPVLVPGSLFDELSALTPPGPEAPLFRSQKKGPDGGPRPITARQAERIVKATARRAGLKNASEVSPHWLRHAHASHAMDRGAKIHLVQATLGHSDISTTDKYLHARPTNPRRSTWAPEKHLSRRTT